MLQLILKSFDQYDSSNFDTCLFVNQGVCLPLHVSTQVVLLYNSSYMAKLSCLFYLCLQDCSGNVDKHFTGNLHPIK